MTTQVLDQTIADMVQPGKGILAADESTPTMAKRLASINVESTEDNRRHYRELMFTTPKLENYISGVILFEETLNQKAENGTPLAQLLADKGIVPGIKVDKGLIAVTNSPGDKVTQGLDGLAERLADYKTKGARFAKWRALLPISDHNPGRLGIKMNAQRLACYAAICQEQGIVPIVEPELFMEGEHSFERCFAATEAVLHAVFHALHQHRVYLEGMVLKPSMVIAGNKNPHQASPEQVAEATVRVLRRTVPAAVPSINFLSGGQTDEQATVHLNLMNQLNTQKPWALSFSYGRALQAPCLKAWGGQAANKAAAQQALLKRAELNGAACRGEYRAEMEGASAAV